MIWIFHYIVKIGKISSISSIPLNVLFASYNSEEIKLANKSNCNKRKNQVILLMINDEANNCHYFAVKKLVRIIFFGMVKK